MAVEGLAESSEGGEADGGDVVVFDFGEVDIGDADSLGEFAERDFAVSHDAGEVEDYFARGVIGGSGLVDGSGWGEGSFGVGNEEEVEFGILRRSGVR